MVRTSFTLAALLTASSAFAQHHVHSPAGTLQTASETLEQVQAIPAQCIPAALLADAQGVAIIPNVVKAGFVVGGRGGHGVVVARDATGAWSGLSFVHIGGASVGLQAGVQSTDLILVFKTRTSLDRVLDGKAKLSLGVDAAVSAGPVGRNASAGTDGKLQAEIFSYSRSRGLFAGVSLDGAVIAADPDTNALFAASSPNVKALATRLSGQLAVASSPQPPAPPAPVLVPIPAPAPAIVPIPAPAPAPVVPQVPR